MKSAVDPIRSAVATRMGRAILRAATNKGMAHGENCSRGDLPRVELAGARGTHHGRCAQARRGHGQARCLRRVSFRSFGDQRHHPAAATSHTRARSGGGSRRGGRRRPHAGSRRSCRFLLHLYVRQMPLLRPGAPGAVPHSRQGAHEPARRHSAHPRCAGRCSQHFLRLRCDGRICDGVGRKRDQNRCLHSARVRCIGGLRRDHRRRCRVQYRASSRSILWLRSSKWQSNSVPRTIY